MSRSDFDHKSPEQKLVDSNELHGQEGNHRDSKDYALKLNEKKEAVGSINHFKTHNWME